MPRNWWGAFLSLSMCRMQSSCRPRLRIKCAAEVKTSETKQAGAAINGKADKEPEYYEVGLTPPVALALVLYTASPSLCTLDLCYIPEGEHGSTGDTRKAPWHQVLTWWRWRCLCSQNRLQDWQHRPSSRGTPALLPRNTSTAPPEHCRALTCKSRDCQSLCSSADADWQGITLLEPPNEP